MEKIEKLLQGQKSSEEITHTLDKILNKIYMGNITLPDAEIESIVRILMSDKFD